MYTSSNLTGTVILPETSSLTLAIPVRYLKHGSILHRSCFAIVFLIKLQLAPVSIRDSIGMLCIVTTVSFNSADLKN